MLLFVFYCTPTHRSLLVLTLSFPPHRSPALGPLHRRSKAPAPDHVPALAYVSREVAEAVRHRPLQDRAVVTRRDERAPVGREGDILDAALVAAQARPHRAAQRRVDELKDRKSVV